MFTVQNCQKLRTGNSRAQFSSNLRQECLLCSIQLFQKVSSENRIPHSHTSLFPLPQYPPAAHSPSPSTSICSTSVCTAATPSASGSAASCCLAGLSPVMLQIPGAVIMINSGTCFVTYCAEGLYRNLHAPGLSRWFFSRFAFSPVITHERPLARGHGSAGSCTPQLSRLPAASPSSETLPFPSCL